MSRQRWIGRASDFSLDRVITWAAEKTVDLERRMREFVLLQRHWRNAD